AVTGPPRSGRRADDRATPFVGRDSDMVALLTALHSARAGEGRAVEIVGETGVGKSRLVAEFCASTDDGVYLTTCDIYGSATPYAPFRALLNAVLDGQPLADVVDQRAPELLPWLPLLGAVIGVDFGSTPEVNALGERFRADRLALTVVQFLGACVTDPTVFVIEDVHLADEASAQLLERISRVAWQFPWLL